MEVSVLLVGRGDVADALVAGLCTRGLELERCDLDEVCAMAQALAAGLVIVVETADGKDTRAVLAQLARERATEQIAVLALGATSQRGAMPAHAGCIPWLGKVELWIEAAANIAARLPRRDVSSLQALADTLTSAPPKHAPAPIRARRASGTLLGQPPPPLGLRAPPPAGAAEPPRGQTRIGRGTLQFPPLPSGAEPPAPQAVPGAPQAAAPRGPEFSTFPPPDSTSALIEDTRPTLRPSHSPKQAGEGAGEATAAAPADASANEGAAIDVEIYEDVMEPAAASAAPEPANAEPATADPTTVRPGGTARERMRSMRAVRDQTPLAWPLEARASDATEPAAATGAPTSASAARLLWPRAAARALPHGIRHPRALLAAAGTAAAAAALFVTSATLQQPRAARAIAPRIAVAAPATPEPQAAPVAPAIHAAANPAPEAAPSDAALPAPAEPAAAEVIGTPDAIVVPSSPRARRTFATTQTSRGHAFLKRGDIEHAEAAYRSALAAVPDAPPAMAGLARVYLQRQDADGAVQWAERVIAKKSRSGNYQLLLGDALALQGRKDDARAAWKRAVRLGNRSARQRLRSSAE